MNNLEYAEALKKMQGKTELDKVWFLQSIMVDLVQELRGAGWDDETVRQMDIAKNHVGDIAVRMGNLTCLECGSDKVRGRCYKCEEADELDRRLTASLVRP